MSKQCLVLVRRSILACSCHPPWVIVMCWAGLGPKALRLGLGLSGLGPSKKPAQPRYWAWAGPGPESTWPRDQKFSSISQTESVSFFIKFELILSSSIQVFLVYYCNWNHGFGGDHTWLFPNLDMIILAAVTGIWHVTLNQIWGSLKSTIGCSKQF